MHAPSRFLGSRTLLTLALGFLVGAGVVSLSAHFLGKKPAPTPPAAAADQNVISDSLLSGLARLKGDPILQTQAEFEKRFAGYEILYPSPDSRRLGGPPLSFEKEKYVAVVLRKEWRYPPYPEPKVWTHRGLHIVRNADGSPLREPDGGIRLELDPGFKRGDLTWAPRMNAEGNYILREDNAKVPLQRTWYLLAAFSPADDHSWRWWCVFTD